MRQHSLTVALALAVECPLTPELKDHSMISLITQLRWPSSKDIQLFQVGESHLSHRWNSEFLKCPYLRNVFRLQNQRVLVHQMAAVAPAAPLVLGRLLFPPILNF